MSPNQRGIHWIITRIMINHLSIHYHHITTGLSAERVGWVEDDVVCLLLLDDLINFTKTPSLI